MKPPHETAATRPFVPVALVATVPRPKRRHWAVAAVLSACKLVVGVLCVYAGLVTFCLTFHFLTLPR